MSSRYYRVMENLKENWTPYWEDPETGRRMEFHSHLDAMFVSSPREGDYLVLREDGSVSALCPTSYDLYRGVKFHNMPSLDSLLVAGVVVETPEEILTEDWRLQARIVHLEGAILELEGKMNEILPKMHERRFGFLTQEARDCRHIYNELKPMLNGLRGELAEVHRDLDGKVVEPLEKLAQERKEWSLASVDDLIFGASSRGVEVLGMKKDFQVEHDLGV